MLCQIRYSAHRSISGSPPPPNPFSFSHWHRNVIEILCRPQGVSWIHATEYATEDKREINPGAIEDIENGEAENAGDGFKLPNSGP